GPVLDVVASLSISSSVSVDNFCPDLVKNLIPFCSTGLCEADMTTPEHASRRRVNAATPGVGRIPTSTTSTPLDKNPEVRQLCKVGPDSLVSRPTTATGEATSLRRIVPNACPILRTNSGTRGHFPAGPLIPSVPNNLSIP